MMMIWKGTTKRVELIQSRGFVGWLVGGGRIIEGIRGITRYVSIYTEYRRVCCCCCTEQYVWHHRDFVDLFLSATASTAHCHHHHHWDYKKRQKKKKRLSQQQQRRRRVMMVNIYTVSYSQYYVYTFVLRCDDGFFHRPTPSGVSPCVVYKAAAAATTTHTVGPSLGLMFLAACSGINPASRFALSPLFSSSSSSPLFISLYYLSPRIFRTRNDTHWSSFWLPHHQKKERETASRERANCCYRLFLAWERDRERERAPPHHHHLVSV